MAYAPPSRYSPAELIEQLREAAEEIAPELPGIRAEETLEGEAAQTIEEMAEALMRIANGAPRPQDLARAALGGQGSPEADRPPQEHRRQDAEADAPLIPSLTDPDL